MFGFPTRVRSLYERRPQRRGDDRTPRSPTARSTSRSRASLRAPRSYATSSSTSRSGSPPGRSPATRRSQIDPLGHRARRSAAAQPAAPSRRALDSEDAPCRSACQATTRSFDLYQPLGFRTDYAPAGLRRPSRARASSAAARSSAGLPERPSRAAHGGIDVLTRSAAEVFSINDNGGELYAMYKLRPNARRSQRQSCTASCHASRTTSSSGEPDVRGAIGCVKPTDVLVLHLDNLALPGPHGVVTTDRAPLPAGVDRALVVRRGLPHRRRARARHRPARARHRPSAVPGRGSEIALRIFIADASENGAGYATRLANPTISPRVFRSHRATTCAATTRRSSTPPSCDSSCPDCLRSYDNRRLHPYLDWRLALDLAAVAQASSSRFVAGSTALRRT